MLFIKRFLTTIGLSVFLCLFISFGAIVVSGAVVGAKAAAEQHAVGYEAGQRAGRQAGQVFGKKYGSTILLGSAALALVISCGLSFSGVLPWCRRDTPVPPLLPRNF